MQHQNNLLTIFNIILLYKFPTQKNFKIYFPIEIKNNYLTNRIRFDSPNKAKGEHSDPLEGNIEKREKKKLCTFVH